MEGRLHSSAFGSFQQQQQGGDRSRLLTQEKQSIVQPYVVSIDQSQRHLLPVSASLISTVSSTNSTSSVPSPTPGVLVHGSSFLKRENHGSPFDPQYGGSYSVERLLQQQASNVVDAKPTISPALLSAVDLVSSAQDPFQALHQRQQEQLAVAQHHLALSASSLLTAGRAAFLQQSESPLAGLQHSLQPLLDTPPPPAVIASPHLQQHRGLPHTDIGPPLPQLNTLVRNIDRRLGGLLITSSAVSEEALSQQQQQQLIDHQLVRGQELQTSHSQHFKRYGFGAGAIISPTSLSASPSSGTGSEQVTANELAALKDDASHYPARTISPLRGRGRPTTNPLLDGSPRQHPCPECGKAFPNNSALVKHRLIHSDERNFVCTICQKAFKRQDHLNGHLNVHKTVKPFVCIFPNCDKSYCDARSLRRHLEHSHSVQNPVVHSSKGTVYIKCDDLETTVIPNRSGSEELSRPTFNLVETSSSSTAPGQDYPADQESFGASTNSSSEEHGQQSLVSPPLGLDQGRRSSTKSVECAQCGRTFKNMPALNGHMRLHSTATGKGDTTPKLGEEMSKGEHTSLSVFMAPPIGNMAHSGHSSSTHGSTPIAGTSPVDSGFQQHHHQHQQALSAPASVSSSSSTYQQQMQQQQAQHDYALQQSYRQEQPGAGLLMYASSQAQHPALLHQLSQQQVHGVYHVSDAQVQTVHDYTSPISSRPPSHCSTTHAMTGFMMEPKQDLDPHQHVQPSHQHNHGYASILSVNTSSLQEASGGNESMLSGSDDPTMMSPHLASLAGLDVSASPDLAMKQASGSGINAGAAGMASGALAPMLAGPSVVDSPYCSTLRADDVEGSGHRQDGVDFGFHSNYAGGGMASSSGTSHLGMHHGGHYHHDHMASHIDSGARSSCHMEGPLDLGPELSKDVDDELIQKELLSFMRFPGPGDGIFNPFMNDEDEMFASVPAKLTERKRHLTAPSALTMGAGAYSAMTHYPGLSSQPEHHYQYGQQQSSSSSFSGYGSKPGSILNNYEQGETSSSMNPMMMDDGGSVSSKHYVGTSFSGGDIDRMLTHAGHVSAGHHASAPSAGNGKKSRPASRQRRKSRGKPDNVFMLLKSVGLRRSFNLPVSPPRFRKHSAAVVEAGSRKFSIGSGGEHRGGTSGKLHHRSGGSLQQRHANRPKPAPLLIPGASLNRFHSQLRSPRLWIGNALSGYAKSGYSTPTPYTPPPILSPVRHGSGLFWTISKALAALAGPKSAPISPRFGRAFWPKALPPAPPCTDSQGGQPGTVVASAVTGSAAIVDSANEALFSGIVANKTSVVSPLDLNLTDETDEQPPATDTTPHINIGFQYQAEIPNFEPAGPPIGYGEYEKADMVFSPKVCENLKDSEIDAYCKVASSAVMTGGGRNVEYAMHLLNALSGDLERAYFTLISPEEGRKILSVAASGCLANYEYVDTCLWSCEEIMKFQEAIVKHDKDFFLISSFVVSKSTKQCIQFYYTWKKMCTDEYKRLRAARRRRILPAMALEPNVYDLRSLGPIETIVPSAAVGSPFTYERQEADQVQNKGSTAEFGRLQEVVRGNEVSDFVAPFERNGDDSTVKSQYENEVDSMIAAYNESPYRESPATETGSTSDTVFPCRLCGKVFYKVKSRNAHMKSHSVGASKKASPAPSSASVGLH